MDNSGVEIRLYNHETGKVFYKDLTKDELIQISMILDTSDEVTVTEQKNNKIQ